MKNIILSILALLVLCLPALSTDGSGEFNGWRYRLTYSGPDGVGGIEHEFSDPDGDGIYEMTDDTGLSIDDTPGGLTIDVVWTGEQVYGTIPLPPPPSVMVVFVDSDGDGDWDHIYILPVY